MHQEDQEYRFDPTVEAPVYLDEDDEGSDAADATNAATAAAATAAASATDSGPAVCQQQKRSADDDAARGCKAKENKNCMSMVIAHLPAASTFSLGLMCGGIILFVTGFFLTRQELGHFVSQNQERRDLTFDVMFPNLLYWICGVSAGLLSYSLLHYSVNVATSAMAARGSGWRPKSRTCVTAAVVMTLLTDSLLITGAGLAACAAFLPLYAQAMFAVKLQRGVTQFDVNHYLATKVVSPNLVVDTQSADAAATASSFPMFYPSLALFIGVCLMEASLIMSLTCLAINRAKLAPRRHSRAKPVDGASNGEDQQGKLGQNTQL